MKQKLSITLSEETISRIEKLTQLLPEKTTDGKPQKVTKSSIIELYSTIANRYFSDEHLSIEYEMLGITDGRRKNNGEDIPL